MKFLLALGSNQTSTWGKPAQTLSFAIETLSIRLGIHPNVSRFYTTPAFPAGAGPDFVNAAIAFEADITPRDLLVKCHTIEEDAQRKRIKRWGQRTLDIDLIAGGDAVLPDRDAHQYWRDLPLAAQRAEAPTELILPHPRLQDRAFVLVPLLDVAPDWRHPILGQTVTEMCAALSQSDKDAVIALKT